MLGLLGAAHVPQDRADVRIENDSAFGVSVLVKGSHGLHGPIGTGDFLEVNSGFKVGENQCLAMRELGQDGRNSLKTFSPLAVFRPVVYRQAGGLPPKKQVLAITDASFRTIKSVERSRDFSIENNTGYDITVVAHGLAGAFGPVGPGKTRSFSGALGVGTTDAVVLALTGPNLDDKPIDFALVRVGADGGRRVRLVVTDKAFGPGGLPPRAGPGNEIPVAALPSLDGRWRMPDGPVVEISGETGRWVELGYLSEFGFKVGEVGHRNMRRNPAKPSEFTGEYLRKFRGGEIDNWYPITVTVTGPSTATSGGQTWTKVDLALGR